MAEMKIRQSVFINLPLEKTFAYVSDLQKLVDWSSVIISIQQISPDKMCTGTMVRSTLSLLGKWLNLTFEVAEYEPACCFALKSVAGMTPCVLCYQFEAAGSGTTVSEEAIIHTMEEEYVHLEEPTIMNTIRYQIEYDLLTLKEVLETRSLV